MPLNEEKHKTKIAAGRELLDLSTGVVEKRILCSPLAGTEFSGGWLTGPLLNFHILGGLLLAPALLLSFFFRRIAAAIAIAASLLCLPLYFYFVAPGAFRWVFRRAEFSVPVEASFNWNTWMVAEIVTLAVTACVGLSQFFGRNLESTR